MPEYRIQPMPAQAPAPLIERLLRVETATVGHTRHWGFMDRRITPLLPRRRVAGTAITLAIPGPDATLLHHALGLLRPGDILVVDRLGDDRHACWGGGVTIAAKKAGAVGGIVDGPCTDLTEIQDSDFPVWCRGLAPITTRILDLGGTLNCPISCGGVTVSAGDLILADESGVLVLSPEEAEAVADAALARQERGQGMEARIKAGELLGAISGASAKVHAASAPSPLPRSGESR